MEWLIELIITSIVSLIVGGFTGYRIGIKKSVKQIQKGGDNSTMIQGGRDVKYK